MFPKRLYMTKSRLGPLSISVSERPSEPWVDPFSPLHSYALTQEREMNGEMDRQRWRKERWPFTTARGSASRSYIIPYTLHHLMASNNPPWRLNVFNVWAQQNGFPNCCYESFQSRSNIHHIVTIVRYAFLFDLIVQKCVVQDESFIFSVWFPMVSCQFKKVTHLHFLTVKN